MGNRIQRFSSRRSGRGGRWSAWPLSFLIGVLFLQIWWDVAGFTLRLEDLTRFVFIALVGAAVIVRTRVNVPLKQLSVGLAMWLSLFVIGVARTALDPEYGHQTRLNAVVNGSRIILALSGFFIIAWWPSAFKDKHRTVLSTIYIMGAVSIVVCCFQIANWFGVLPFSLPAFLTRLPPAIQERAVAGDLSVVGKMIYGLFLGERLAHTASGVLGMLFLVCWVELRFSAASLKAKWGRFGLCIAIWAVLFAMSVRNTLVGLVGAIVVLEFLRVLARKELRSISRALAGWMALTGLIVGTLYVAPEGSILARRIQVLMPEWGPQGLSVSGLTNIYGRFEYWGAGLQLLREYPLFGSGFSSFEANTGIIHAHNSYVTTIAEFGLVGIAGVVALTIGIGLFIKNTANWLVLDNDRAVLYAISVGCLTFLMLTAIFGNTLYLPAYVGFCAWPLGLLAAEDQQLRRRPSAKERERERKNRTVL